MRQSEYKHPHNARCYAEMLAALRAGYWAAVASRDGEAVARARLEIVTAVTGDGCGLHLYHVRGTLAMLDSLADRLAAGNAAMDEHEFGGG